MDGLVVGGLAFSIVMALGGIYKVLTSTELEKPISIDEGETPEWRSEYLKALWELDKEFPATQEAKEPTTNKIVSGNFSRLLSPGLSDLYKQQSMLQQYSPFNDLNRQYQQQQGMQNQLGSNPMGLAGLAGQQDLSYLLGVNRKREPN